ncbi:hypothetical protein BH10BAC5_BH10BAC5_14020 [soil metagenome]
MSQQELLKKVVQLLNRINVDYMLTGSVVSSIQGEPRSTHDIDIVVNISEHSISSIIKEFLPPRYYIDESAIVEAIQNQNMFNLLDTNEGDKVDFWILTKSPFDVSRFSRKYEDDFFGITVNVSTPEDTIVSKLKWAKESNNCQKQLGDVIRITEIQYGNLNFSYIEKWVSILDLKDLWLQVLKQVKPIL